MAGDSTQKTVEEIVNMILVENLGVGAEEITPESSLADDLGADSLDIVEVVMGLEEQFDIEILDEDYEGIQTVSAVVSYIKKKLAEKE